MGLSFVEIHRDSGKPASEGQMRSGLAATVSSQSASQAECSCSCCAVCVVRWDLTKRCDLYRWLVVLLCPAIFDVIASTRKRLFVCAAGRKRKQAKCWPTVLQVESTVLYIVYLGLKCTCGGCIIGRTVVMHSLSSSLLRPYEGSPEHNSQHYTLQ